MAAPLAWIEAGRRFGFDELVHWRDRGHEPFERAAGRIDTIVLGPHASAAFPRELAPFVASTLTRRKQFDYSDVVTADLGRAWADADPRVAFVANPHSRLVLDPNRAPPADAVAGLREFFARLARARAGADVSYAGIDAVRPVTFSGEDVLVEPRDEPGWNALAAALSGAIAAGPAMYRAACVRVVDQVTRARPGRRVLVVSLHDTMNTRMRADGAIAVERPAADRLPDWVNFGNRGDERGERESDPLTVDGGELRRIAAAWSETLEATSGAITLNRPYKGAYETTAFGARIAGHATGSGAVQVEFRREALIGAAAIHALHGPGEDWPDFDLAHIRGVAARLARAGAALRLDGD